MIEFGVTICPIMSRPNEIVFCQKECAMLITYNTDNENYVCYCGLCPEHQYDRS